MTKYLLPLWLVAAISLLLYSFTQVDLSLTLSQVSVWQGIQKSFQYVGYFNRPLSAGIFVAIMSLMFVLYIYTVNQAAKKLIDLKKIMVIVVLVSGVLFFSYNAFSHDLFNYIFDAKIITQYNENPYEHKALDYPGDPMLSFMHWTHRTYPYGPIWLALTVPLSYLGFGIFLVTFYLFKMLIVISFIGSVLFVGKIAKKLNINEAMAVSAFAFNPLVLTESLVSAHNDIVMVFLALLSIYLFIEKRYVTSFITLVASIALKYATALIIPAIIARGLFKASREMFLYILILSMIFAVLFATYRTNFQPWYLLYVIPFAAFLYNKYFIAIPLVILSIAGLSQYLPYLYIGDWNPPVPALLVNIMIAGIGLSICVVLGRLLIRRT